MKKGVKTFTLIILGIALSVPGNLAGQDVKTDVRKEYDEDGNLSRYDSCRTWSYRSDTIIDLDSILNQFFPDQFFSGPWIGPDFQGMPNFPFPDSIWSHPGSFPFSDSSRADFFGPVFPFEDWPFSDSIRAENFGSTIPWDDWPFPDMEEMMRAHRERMQKFFPDYTPPNDSTPGIHLEKRTIPDQVRKRQTVEI